MFKSLMKAATAVVDVPVSVAADVVTLGGALSDNGRSYTGEALERFVKNVENAAKPDGGQPND
jgi:hypothetical protein